MHDASAVEHHRPGADVGDLLGRVAHEDDRATLLLELPDLVHALALEGLVADGEDLVDEQEVGIEWTATANASRTYMPDE